MSLLENFRAARWFRTANLLLQALLFLTLFGGLNYLAQNHPWRKDLTRYNRYSLSPETLAYLKDLPSPVSVTVTSAEASAASELRGLLREYAYATEPNGDRRISVEYLDVDANRHRAQELGLDQPGQVFVRCGTKHRAMGIDELYRMQVGTGRAFFQGEQMITAAILDVSSPEQKKIYFLVGHGELRPEDPDSARGLSAARDVLRLRDFLVDTVYLDQSRKIPADASLLISVSPRSAYTPFELELLRKYLTADAGRLILFLSPEAPTGLRKLLQDWGVHLDDDLLCDTGTSNVTEDGDLIINRMAPHPVTQALINYGLPLRIGRARTLRPDAALAAANGLDARVIAFSSPSAWGETEFQNRRAATFRAGDIRPQADWDPPDGLGIAVASERVAARDNLPFSVPRGRLVVVGTGDLISNARIANAGAEYFLLGAVNWTVDRDTQLNIPARPVDQFQLSLSAGELARLRFSLMLGLPGAVAVLGLLVYWTRRN